MRTEEFVMRGQTASGESEVLQFSGLKPGYAYRMTNFELYPSTGIGSESNEFVASVTAEKHIPDPSAPNFDNEGLIAVCQQSQASSPLYSSGSNTVIDHTFLITQNLILVVRDISNGRPVNWQCTFMPVKLTGPQEAVANYRQFTILDD